MSTSGPVVPDTALGLTNDQIATLRQAQVAANAAGSSSSRAASRASSSGMLMLDTSSLARLGHYLDRLMVQIQNQLQALTAQMEAASLRMNSGAANTIESADAEMARTNAILAQLDELDNEWDRLAAIKEIVSQYRYRAEELERAMERPQTSSSRREGHRSHGHGHSHGHHRSHHGHSSSSKHHRH